MAADLEKIRAAAERVAGSHGLSVVDVEITGGGKNRVLTVYLEKNAAGRTKMKAELAAKLEAAKVAAEKAEAGEEVEAELVNAHEIPVRLLEGRMPIEHLSFITHEDCANFSRDFGVLLDVEDLIPGAEYTLEASSPGLDRKLRTAEDFTRFNGSLVKIQSFTPIAGNRHWQGRLIAASKAGSICIDLAAVKQNSKARKTGVKSVEIEISNVEKANLIAEI
jgi:ribosome maturation factor RimP